MSCLENMYSEYMESIKLPRPQTLIIASAPCSQVPPEIGHPDYADDGMPKGGNPPPAWVIEVKTEEDIAGMTAAGKVARYVCRQ